jgi:K+/H+ antiporter YhaU regulatory subunit KhtT
MLVVSPEPVLILNKGNMFIVLGTRKHNCIVADLCDALVHLFVAKLAQ